MKNNRIGLILVVSSLAIIALVVALLLQRQQAAQADQVRIQGLGMVRSLAALPAAMLVPGDGPGVLDSVLAHRDNPDFAYAAVSTDEGRNLAEFASPGALIPAAVSLALTGFDERRIDASARQRAIREFRGPVANAENRLQVRIGYFEPDTSLNMKDVSFYAIIALAMFLLVPLIYFVIKREMAPLTALSEQLRAIVPSQALAPVTVNADQDVRGLVQKLNGYIDQAGSRIRALEQDSMASMASSRLLEYGSNKMQSVLHCLPDGLLVLDPAGEVTFANGKIEPLLGVPVPDVLSQPVDVWCRDPDLRAMLARYRGTGADTRSQATIEFSPLGVPGKRLWGTAQALVGHSMAYGTLVVLRDATREHLARQAGNDFVAHVAHELKSPLNVIGMYGEMLGDAGATDPEIRVEAVNVIQDEVERMSSLVNNLLNVSKLETGSMRPERHRVRLDDLLNDAWTQAMSRASSKGIKLDLQVPREISAVSIDKDLFRIALNNLLNNAIKYNRPGGSVVLSAEEGDSDVVLSVRDSGIGMSPEDRQRVTEKFYRARETSADHAGGHGLGLYLANQIIELHHARLTIDSELGQGSVFSIHLKKMPALVAGAQVL
ncbi:PAS domain-containing sensor histidine kinase [Massilia sp. H6]|uniref:PAS domain-containing sensor histidine kinase n=1 Tax=Massilia sp. H6 TaxID=2970464 RepID=UPI002167F96C|nr:PAS domain-containing sensor histidine kinase [Massilia sp. H6]UVW28722.1 PAS domain-containing sensor histidine kinase [Massilia sp. H6]